MRPNSSRMWCYFRTKVLHPRRTSRLHAPRVSSPRMDSVTHWLLTCVNVRLQLAALRAVQLSEAARRAGLVFAADLQLHPVAELRN